jgi:hypothetical protein
MRLLILVLTAGPLLAAEERVEFNRDVRPILADRCFACHGADAKAKGVPLRLDIEEEAKKDLGKGSRAIVPHDAAASQLMLRVTKEGGALRMPPVSAGTGLTQGEIEILRKWIAQGAPWQRHWAFLPPVKKPGNIDTFVRARLAAEGLRPSQPARAETLIRRATLDLTGLPPAVAEVDAFLADRSPQAYENLIERLLDSPRFGRMATSMTANA